jgi:hypothetical protein
MPFSPRAVDVPSLPAPEEAPVVPAALHAARADRAYAAAGVDWLVVYGDLEHFANMAYLSGHDPRFEEALLLLGRGGRRVLVHGNEGGDHATLAALPGLERVLAQSFSLPGMDRSVAPRLTDALRAAGLRPGDRVGLVGWKPYAPEESEEGETIFAAPHAVVAALRRIVGAEGLVDRTGVLMDPATGLRAVNEIEQIEAFEWAANRASRAVRAIVSGVRPGMRESEAMAAMAYHGEPLTCRVMFSASRGPIVGLKSPSSKRIAPGEGATTAVAYRGGLTARAGMIVESDPDFVERIAAPYYEALALWCASVRIGEPGRLMHARIAAALAPAGLASAFTPGHLGGHDEWLHSVSGAASAIGYRSGALIQCDIIPTPMPEGVACNCEDPFVLLDAADGAALAAAKPALMQRLAARRRFLEETIGLTMAEGLYPLVDWALCYPPGWLKPERIMVRT